MPENDQIPTGEIPRHRHPSTWWLLAPAAVAVAAVVFGVVISHERPVPVTVDGVPRVLKEGTTVAELAEQGVFSARPGRLLSVKGSVIATEGGAPVAVLVNGRRVDATQYVFRNDVVTSQGGADVIEGTVTHREPIPVKTRVTGHGPVMRLANPGTVGVKLRTAGAKSGETVTETVVVPEQDMLVIRTEPRPKEKLIALTFDDGPWPGQTDKILKILEQQGARATFFMLGVRVNKAPELAREVAQAGHTVGNHSLGHRFLPKQKPKEIARQIENASQDIYQATGILPTWFRPPYGAMNEAVWKQVRLSRLRVALWDIDTRDWAHPGVKKIVHGAMKHAHPGAILLMHDGGEDRGQTIRALPEIIKKLKKKGYVFVTLDDLESAN